MRPSIGESLVYYYFILNFATFPQTNTPVLMDCCVGHPLMTILPIWMILRIGWTILTLFVLPYSMSGYCLLLPHHTPLIWGFVSRGEFCWHTAAHSVFWAKHVTVLRSTSLSPYFMVHSVEPLFPFDLAKATFLVPPSDTEPLSSSGLIAWRA